jgi:hypothetical protein
MKKYFRNKMTLNEAYTNNNEGNPTLFGSSANVIEQEQEEKLANLGDEIREYIQQLTGAKENVPPPSNYTSNMSSNKAAEAMDKQMSKIEELLIALTVSNKNQGSGGNDDKNRGGGGDDKNADKDRKKWKDCERKPMQLYRNMGGYCHSCGFCPVGKDHTSVTCHMKRATHDDNATWTNRGTNGSMVWPSRVRDEEQNHESWAGKSAPTN